MTDNNTCPEEYKLDKEDIELLKKIKHARKTTEKEAQTTLSHKIKHRIDCDLQNTKKIESTN